MSERRFLITFPNDDTTTYYLFIWERDILDYASKKGIDFTKFEGKEVTRHTIEKFVSKINPRFVIVLGKDTTHIVREGIALLLRKVFLPF